MKWVSDPLKELYLSASWEGLGRENGRVSAHCEAESTALRSSEQARVAGTKAGDREAWRPGSRSSSARATGPHWSGKELRFPSGVRGSRWRVFSRGVTASVFHSVVTQASVGRTNPNVADSGNQLEGFCSDVEGRGEQGSRNGGGGRK